MIGERASQNAGIHSIESLENGKKKDCKRNERCTIDTLDNCFEERNFEANAENLFGNSNADISHNEDVKFAVSEDENKHINAVDSALTEAIHLYNDDRLLDASRAFRRLEIARDIIPDNPQVRAMLDRGTKFEDLVRCITSEDSARWTRIGEARSMSGYWTEICSCVGSVSGKVRKLEVKITSLLPKSMVEPVIAILNETSLYSSWVPRWEMPRIALVDSETLEQRGRCSKLVRFRMELPWPLATREFILDVVACDDVETTGTIAVSVETVENFPLPPTNNVIRGNCNIGILFHPASRLDLEHARQDGVDIKDEDEYLLLSSHWVYNTVLPETLIRFGLRVAVGISWGKFLRVAEDIRDGRRPDHMAAMESNRNLYSWVEDRVRVT